MSISGLSIDSLRRGMPLRLRYRSSGSKLEAKLALYWNSLGGPPLEREYRFDPSRRWRADFAHEPSRTLIGIEEKCKAEKRLLMGF